MSGKSRSRGGRRRSVALLLVLLAGAVRCGNGSLTTGSAGTSTPPTVTRSVSIQNNAFSPSSIQASPGDTITFTNLDGTPHNATFSTASITSTGDFSTGSRSVIMPLADGTYNFHCTIHPTMTGSILVQ